MALTMDKMRLCYKGQAGHSDHAVDEIDEVEVNDGRGSANRYHGDLNNIYPRQKQADWSERTKGRLLMEIDSFRGLNISSTSIPYHEPAVTRSMSNNPDLGTENTEVDTLTRGSGQDTRA